MPSNVRFMGVRLRLAGKTEVLAAIEAGERLRVATPNPEFILEARSNPAFKKALETSLCTVDGSGLQMGLALWRLREKFETVERYHGADLVEDLLAQYADGSRSFYLLGAQPGVAEKTAASWKKRYPGLNIAGTSTGGLKISRTDPRIDAETEADIARVKPDIILVAFGMPKQELWMHSSDLAPVMIGVGGTFDFYVNKKRAPKAWRALRLEWLYRGFIEKGHWRRIWRATVVYCLAFAWSFVSGK